MTTVGLGASIAGPSLIGPMGPLADLPAIIPFLSPDNQQRTLSVIWNSQPSLQAWLLETFNFQGPTQSDAAQSDDASSDAA